jgi:hypothetical protein
MIIDLQDDRRAAKTWLPFGGDDRDVTNALVTEGKDGKPRCWRHGAMNRVDPHRRIYRCQEWHCGVGAEVVPDPGGAWDAFWAEVEAAAGTGTRSVLLGTSTRSLRKGLARMRAQQEREGWPLPG